MPYKMEVMKP
uniref:Uncharacterized protein n=1 Tax=Moniliophthora roreri TaxID=221103 RepID=A0A0W0F6T8_MONRR